MTRILALHGFRTSGKIMKLQTARMARLTGCEIVAVDACHKASGPPHAEVEKWFGSDGPFFEHYNAIEDDNGKFTYVGVDKSLKHLSKIIEEQGPFDIAMGFSQGTNLLTMYIASLENQSIKPPFRAAILFCGTFPRCENPTFKYPNKILSLHVLGEQDPIIDLSKELANNYYQKETRTILSHKGGHMPPSGGQDECIYKIKEWMLQNGFDVQD